MVRVALADDSALFREGLAGLLTAAGVEVVASAANGVELEHALSRQPADAVVVDLRMPPTYRDEGIATALRLRARSPRLAVLVLSTYLQLADALRLLQDGAAGLGYLLKDRVDDIDVLSDTLRRLMAGESVLDAEIVAGVLSSRAAGPLDVLTARERVVLELMAQGRSNAGIGAALFLSPKTVETHVAALFAKLGFQPAHSDNRRVLAVLAYLESVSAAGR